jgi:hypothetical protein
MDHSSPAIPAEAGPRYRVIMRLLGIVAIGIGATVFIDLWSTFLKKAFGIPSLSYCLLGRWVLHMPRGRVMHVAIAKSEAMPHECKVGWTAHYSIGVAFSVLFVLLVPGDWLSRPTLGPALVFGVATVLVPFLTMQPAFGLGIAASRTKNPTAARLKSLVTHAIFGVGLYAWASLLSR